MIASVIPAGFVVPTTAHQFNYQRVAGGLVSIPMTVAIIATKAANGTAVVGQVYDATDPITTDLLGGQSSEGAIMCRQAYLCAQVFKQGPRIKVTFLNEATGGTARVQTITFVGNATSDGNFLFTVAGRAFTVGIQNGQSPSTIAANLAAILNLRADELPVLISVAAGVVTFTHPTKGVNGNDVKITIDQQVSGTVATLAQTAAGLGAVDLQPAINALAPRRYDAICTANHTTADITEILLDLAVRWANTSKTWAWWFLFEPGSIGTGTALAASANHRAVIVGSMEGCRSAPGEGAVTTACMVFSRAKPNSGYDGVVVPLYPPDDATVYTPPEQNTAILAGLTPFVAVIDATGAEVAARAKCVMGVTTKTTTPAGLPDDVNRDIAVARTGVYLALQLDAAWSRMTDPDVNPDGISQDDALVLVADLNADILRTEARQPSPIISKALVEQDIAAFVAAKDGTVLGLIDTNTFYHVNTPNHQVGWNHNVQVGG